MSGETKAKLIVKHDLFADSAQCGDPGLSADTFRTIFGTREGGVVEYSCKFGFRLEGGYNRTCLSSGQWSGSLPSCKSKSCIKKIVHDVSVLFFWFRN